MPSSFEADYPTITRWVKESGRIEIGGASFADPFVKAVNRDGMLRGGKREYTSSDEALRDMDRGIETSMLEQARASPSRTGKTRSRRPRKTKSRADKDQQIGEELLIPAGAIHSARNIGANTALWLYGYKR